ATAPADPAQPQKESRYGALLGLEGAGAAQYFRVFPCLIKGEWGFKKRQRRPPRDPVNALLSFGYSLLTNQAASAVNVVGLDPFVGYLHSSQYGKPAMALDIMEPYRPLIVDSTVITLINNGMLTRDDFREQLGAWQLTKRGRRVFLQKYEDRLNTTIVHPEFGYSVTYRRCLELEARLVSKWLMGEISEYKPMVVR
ncbi:CRISPR-associated endonuclease Cas1, partial [Candidatus Parcubacteria bacterium]